MAALPYIVGGGVLLLVVAAASKAKAAPASSTTTKPTGSTTPKPTTTPAASTGGPGTTAPAYLASVPYVIALRVIQISDPSVQQAQGVWLTDNGFPKTGEAVQQYSRGEITDIELRQIAQAEFKAAGVSTSTSSTTKPQGTTKPDTYGTWLLENGDDETLYSYASTATSIPFVAAAAARLAAAGDTRATELTQHLADIST